MGMSCSGVVVWCGLSSACLAGLQRGCCIHQPWDFLSLYFKVPVTTLGPTMGLQGYSPSTPPSSCCKTPWSKQERWEQTPALRDL